MIRLGRRTLYMIFFLTVAFIFIYSYTLFEEKKETVIKEYFAHKRFLRDLREAVYKERKYATEKELRNLIIRYGLEIENIKRTGSGIEVKIREVYWKELIKLLKEIEDRYEIVSFRAVDNTGKGLFEVRLVVR